MRCSIVLTKWSQDLLFCQCMCLVELHVCSIMHVARSRCTWMHNALRPLLAAHLALASRLTPNILKGYLSMSHEPRPQEAFCKTHGVVLGKNLSACCLGALQEHHLAPCCQLAPGCEWFLGGGSWHASMSGSIGYLVVVLGMQSCLAAFIVGNLSHMHTCQTKQVLSPLLAP